MPSMPESGPFSRWMGHAARKVAWESMIESLGANTCRKRSSDNGCDSCTRSRTNNDPPHPPSPPPQQRSNANESSPPSPLQRTPLSRAKAFRTLGIDQNASIREIVLSFRMLSRRFHPDKWSEDLPFSMVEGVEKFKEIANARDMLLDGM